MSFLVIGRIEARGANAQGASWFLGPPGPLPALGLAHRLSRELNANVGGVAVVMHRFEHRAECHPRDTVKYNFHQPRAASFIDANDYARSNRHVLSAQPVALCDLEVSLLIELEKGSRPELDHARAVLAGARYAGGRLEPFEERAVRVVEDLQEAARSVGTGHQLVERIDLLENTTGAARLERLLTLVGSKREKDDPWLIPMPLGYRALTDTAIRAGAREGAPHAFVETLAGLVELRKDWNSSPPLWHYRHPSTDLYIATTNGERHS